jgi:FixJ family two-component response regulator
VAQYFVLRHEIRLPSCPGDDENPVVSADLQQILGTVYLVDPDPASRSALAQSLEAIAYRVRAFDDAESFLRGYDRDERTALACLITELHLPGAGGLELQAELRSAAPQLPVVFLAARSDVQSAVTAMKQGAVDFLLRPCETAAVCRLVDEVLARARHERLEQRQAHLPPTVRANLTRREVQVLEAIVAGRLNKQIAAELGISIKTVEVHRANLMSKLHARTVAELIRIVFDDATAA